MTSAEITGHARRDGVEVAVGPGGALSSLTLTNAALALGPAALASTVLAAVEEATALANQRTRHALRDSLAGVDPAAVGFAQSEELTERVESTVPTTWRAP